jgi:hypothetical protein
MKTYKYTVESYADLNRLPLFLNNMGKQGWRVVSIIQQNPETTVVYEMEEEEEKLKPTNDQPGRMESVGLCFGCGECLLECKCERSCYPQNLRDDADKPLYYVEFHKWPEETKTHWTLFQRQFICSKEDWKKTKHCLLESRELHPWNLGEGVVNDREHAMDMNTKRFLIFMVDALNRMVENKTKAEEFKKDVDTYTRERDGY